MLNCRLCGGTETKVIFSEAGIEIRKCGRCRQVFSTFDQPQDYDGYYSPAIAAQDHFWWQAAHLKMFRSFCKKFLTGRSGRLLDFGCGLGYFLETARAEKAWELFGLEISRAASEFARKKLGLNNITTGPISQNHFAGQSFDLVTMWDVIEHLPDPRPALKQINSLLKPDGLLFIHTPNILIQLPKARFKKRWWGQPTDGNYLEAKDHINIYSPQTIRNLLFSSGFRKISFIHLPPIQSAAGSKSRGLKIIKNIVFGFSRWLAIFTANRVNFDNLFIIATK